MQAMMKVSEKSLSAIQRMRDGRIRNHKLGNSAREHTGEPELLEYQRFRDFLPSLNGCMVFNLIGNDNYV